MFTRDIMLCYGEFFMLPRAAIRHYERFDAAADERWLPTLLRRYDTDYVTSLMPLLRCSRNIR